MHIYFLSKSLTAVRIQSLIQLALTLTIHMCTSPCGQPLVAVFLVPWAWECPVVPDPAWPSLQILPGVKVIIAHTETRGPLGDTHLGEVRLGGAWGLTALCPGRGEAGRGLGPHCPLSPLSASLAY